MTDQEHIKQLESDNARLSAALNKAKTAYDRLYSFHGTPTPPPNLTCTQKQCDWCEVGEALDEPNQALHNLLAPTIELFRSVLRDDKDCPFREIESELQRLRALCGEGKER